MMIDWGKGSISGVLARDPGYYRAVKHLPALKQTSRRKEKLEIAWWVCVVPLPSLVLPSNFQYFPLHSPFSTWCQIVSSGGISLAIDVG